MKIAYLGDKKTYTYLCASKAFDVNSNTFIAYETISKAIRACDEEQVDFTVVPIENSIEGSVNETLDMLIWESRLYVHKELCMHINHRLITLKDADEGKINKIYAHVQAYAQCRKSLEKAYPNAQIVMCDNNGKAVESITDIFSAALGGGVNLSDKHKASEKIYNDVKNNITDFVVLAKKVDLSSLENKQVFIIFEAENKPGGLLRILEVLNSRGLNMTKIESRPYKTEHGRYIFIVNFISPKDRAELMNALDEISKKTSFLKFLGAYSSESI